MGFGDYAPRSNIERASGAFVLLTGVAMFSYLMGNFIEILEAYQNLNKELIELRETHVRVMGASWFAREWP